MNTHLLHEVPKDDVALYKDAEQRRLPATPFPEPENAKSDRMRSLRLIGLRPINYTGLNLKRWFVRVGSAAGLLVLALMLISCAVPATGGVPAATATTPPVAAPETPPLVIVHTADAINVPAAIPAGLRRITIQNNDENDHASIFRRLNDDVTMEQFMAAFQENPFGSLPLTTQLGGPDLSPGTSSENAFHFEPGSYVLVDNWVQPPRLQPFNVAASDMADDSAPDAAVVVEMKEHEFVMPTTLKAGRQWWEFHNTGESMHQAGVAQLAPGKTIDDIAAWLETEEGMPPWEDIAFWNVTSPGQQSWGELDLPPGEYLMLDYLPDFANDGTPNFMLGMMKEIVVTE